MLDISLLRNILKRAENNSTRIKIQSSKKYAHILNDPDSKFWVYLNFIMIFFIIISIILMIFQSVWDNISKYPTAIFLVDATISIVFWLEYFYRLFKSFYKIKFVLNTMNIIDFFSFAPFFLEIIFETTLWLRFLRVLKLFRIFRTLMLFKFFTLIDRITISIKNYKYEYKMLLLLIFIISMIWAVFLNNIEWNINPWFKTILNSFWWSIVTITTVWYWDIVPITWLGKLIWVILVLFGPIFFALMSSLTIMVFLEVINTNRGNLLLEGKDTECGYCKEKIPDTSNFCFNCGKQINKENNKISKQKK